MGLAMPGMLRRRMLQRQAKSFVRIWIIVQQVPGHQERASRLVSDPDGPGENPRIRIDMSSVKILVNTRSTRECTDMVRVRV